MAFHRLDDDPPLVANSTWAANCAWLIGCVNGPRSRKAGRSKPG